MARNYFFYLFCYLYIEIANFFMSHQHPPSRNPITDLPQPISVNTYLDILLLAIQCSKEPLQLLTKSRVTRVRMAKEIDGVQHEYSLAEVSLDGETFGFRVERTRGAKPQRTVEELRASGNPELVEVANELNGDLGAPPSETTATFRSFPVGTAEPASETLPSVSPVQEPNVSYPTRLENFSISSLSSLDTPKSLLKSPRRASDTISRVTSLVPPFPDVILHDIYPKDLTWPQFILIINLVHSEDELYSAIGSQCYWYSQLVFLLIQAIFCPGRKESAPPTNLTVPVHISRHLSYPDPERQFIKLESSKDGMAPGTWMSVLVTRIELSLLKRLLSKFNLRWPVIRKNIESWAEKAEKAEKAEEALEKANAEIQNLKKQSQTTTNGGSASGSRSRSRPHIPGRGMSTLPRGFGLGTGTQAGIWTGPLTTRRFNSLRALAPPPVKQNRVLDLFGHLFKRK